MFTRSNVVSLDIELYDIITEPKSIEDTKFRN